MIHITQDARTYDLTTASGALSAGTQTAAPLIAIVLGVLNLEKWWGILIAGVAGVVLLAWVAPAWLFWLRRNLAETTKAENTAMVVTERVRLEEIKLDLEHARAETLDKLRQLDHDQISLALELERGELFDVSGNRVTWTVNGVVMPVTFSLDWMEKWEKRRSANSDQLPAQGDWDADSHREQCRQYNAAIIGALVKLGYVQSAGSQYPGRWLYNDDTYRWNGLALIGLDLALAISRGILNLDPEGDRNG